VVPFPLSLSSALHALSESISLIQILTAALYVQRVRYYKLNVLSFMIGLVCFEQEQVVMVLISFQIQTCLFGELKLD
jgi:hypothetical protein